MKRGLMGGNNKQHSIILVHREMVMGRTSTAKFSIQDGQEEIQESGSKS